MTGVLTDQQTGEPVPGAKVVLGLPFNSRNAWERSKHPDPIESTTDRLGAFSLEDVPSEWNADSLYSCTATLGGTIPVFNGYVSLLGPLNLKGRLPRIARGQLVAGPGFDYQATTVRLEPENGSGFARTQLDEHGYFETLLPMDLEAERFNLFFFQNNVRGCFSVSASAESLCGEALAMLECKPTIVTIECRDSEGKPIESAAVRLGSLLPSQPLFIEEYYTNEEGLVTVIAEAGENEVCLAKKGYWTHLDIIDSSSVGLHRFVLQRMVEDSLVRGQVVAPDGSPVALAFVTAVPVGQIEEVALAGLPSCVSEESGSFRLAVNYRGTLRFRAFQRRYGFSEAVESGAFGSHIRLPFRAFGTVTLDLKYSFEPDDYLGGLPEYFLVDRYRHEVYSGASRPPVHVTDIPEGEYNLYVKFPGGGGYIQTSVSVEAGQERRQSAIVEPAYWHEGLLVNGLGLGIADVVARVAATWPREVAEGWGTCRTGEDGRFRVFAGRLSTARIDLLDANGTVLGGFHSVSGAPSRHVLARDGD